jgi:hypothetical protein
MIDYVLVNQEGAVIIVTAFVCRCQSSGYVNPKCLKGFLVEVVSEQIAAV